MKSKTKRDVAERFPDIGRKFHRLGLPPKVRVHNRTILSFKLYFISLNVYSFLKLIFLYFKFNSNFTCLTPIPSLFDSHLDCKSN